MKPLSMNRTVSLAAAAGLFVLILIAGCTSPTGTGFPPPGTQEATVSPVPPTAVPATPVVETPEAVSTLPEEQFVDIAVTKERPDATIHLLYNGGKGELSVQSVLLVVTRSDGQVIQEYLNDNSRKPQRGDELVVQGTRGTDRAEVYVTSANKVYKIFDKPLVTAPV